MARPAAFDLVPLMLPEPRGRLLVAGWHPALEGIDWSSWQDVTFLRRQGTHSTARAKGPTWDVDAVLIVDTGLLPATGRRAGGLPQVPTATLCRGALVRSRIPRQGALVRQGFPIVGRTLIWAETSPNGHRHLDAFPRGRFDSPWLALQRYLLPLRALGAGWTVSADPNRSILARILGEAGIDGGNWHHTRNNVLMAMNEKAVVRVPLHPVPRGYFVRQGEKCERIRATVRGKEIERLLPRGQREIQVGKHVAGIECRLPGRSAFSLLGKRSRIEVVFRAAAGFLEQWYASTTRTDSVDESFFREHWVTPLKPLSDALNAQGDGAIWSELIDLMRSRVAGRAIPCVPVHGDFWLNNLLIDPQNDSLCGIVDWGNSSLRGLPLLDLFHLMTWRTERMARDHSLRVFRRMMRNEAHGAQALAHAHCARLGIEPRWVPDLFCRYWLGQLAQRAGQLFPTSTGKFGLTEMAEALSSQPPPQRLSTTSHTASCSF